MNGQANKLIEKFKTKVSINTSGESERFAKQCEQITDDFAVKFAEFVEKYNTQHRIHKRADELLQIFKNNYYE